MYTVSSVYFYRFIVFMFFKMYIRTYLPYCLHHLSMSLFHAYSGIVLVRILLSTLKGTKGPFIFIKVEKKSPKYFALNVPKLKGHYSMINSNFHHLTSVIESSFEIRFPSQCHVNHCKDCAPK